MGELARGEGGISYPVPTRAYSLSLFNLINGMFAALRRHEHNREEIFCNNVNYYADGLNINHPRLLVEMHCMHEISNVKCKCYYGNLPTFR